MGHGRHVSASSPEISTVADQLKINCIGLWPLNDNLPTKVVADTSGRGHYGTTYFNTEDFSVAGKINRALYCQKGPSIPESKFVTVPHHEDFNFGTSKDFSVCFWFQRKATANFKYLDYFHSAAGWYFVGSRGNKMCLNLKPYNSTDITVTSVSEISNNIWYFVLVTVSRVGTMKLYWNGNYESQSVSIAGTPTIEDGQDLLIPDTDSGYNVYMDSVMLFKKSLTAAEIAYLWNFGNGREHF